MSGAGTQYAGYMTQVCEGCGVPHVEAGFEDTADGRRCATCVQLAAWADYREVLAQPHRRRVEGPCSGFVE